MSQLVENVVAIFFILFYFFFTIFLLRLCIFKEAENKISHACADALVCAHVHTDRHTHTHTRQPKALACCSSEERWDPWPKRKLTDSHQPIIVKRKTPLRIKPLCQGLTDFAIGPRMLLSSYWSGWALPRPTWRLNFIKHFSGTSCVPAAEDIKMTKLWPAAWSRSHGETY